MAVQNPVYINVDAIVGPTPISCAEYREQLRELAEEANARAAQAFLDGFDAQGSIYLDFSERLTQLAGRRP